MDEISSTSVIAASVGIVIDIVARPEGIEPPTPRLEGACSIQLSYGRLGET